MTTYRFDPTFDPNQPADGDLPPEVHQLFADSLRRMAGELDEIRKVVQTFDHENGHFDTQVATIGTMLYSRGFMPQELAAMVGILLETEAREGRNVR